MIACPGCGKRAGSRFRYCSACGDPLPGSHERDAIRRFGTVVQSDLKGSTSLGEKLDPETLREVLGRYFDEMRLVFESRGGRIEKIIGDAIIAVFGLGGRGADHALRALDAAAESQRVLASLNDQLEERWGVRLVVRTGVATGEIIVGDPRAGQRVLTGDTMQVAAAMEQNAPPLEVLVAGSTVRLAGEQVVTEAHPPVARKGIDEALEAFRLVSVAHGPTKGERRRRRTSECPNCGEPSTEATRFCGLCGVPVSAHGPTADTRKTVTIVFADPKPMTASGEPPQAEVVRDVMARYFDEMRRILERHGGTVEKFIGDAVMAVFGLPVRHEDDALRAVRASAEMQAAMPVLNEAFEQEHALSLLSRIGVNTGEVVAGDAALGQRLVTGDAVNVAARLEQAAGDLEVLLGGLTRQLAGDAVEVEAMEPLTLKGKAEPVPAFRLAAARAAGTVAVRRQAAPLVGREREVAQLWETYRAAVDGRTCRMVTVLGEAGVGKTRLTLEFLDSVGSAARVLKGRCLPYGDGITFWPIVEIVREAADIRDDDPPDAARTRIASLLGPSHADVTERLAAVIGLSSTPYPVGELFWAIRRLVELLAARSPLVLLVDDIHWAEQTFLDLLDTLTTRVEDAPALLLVTARPVLLEQHPDWAGASEATRIELGPLTDADAERVVDSLLGESGIAPAVRERIVRAAEGNPLFVEQLLSMLLDSGRLRVEDGRWVPVGDLSRMAIPPTIHALLAARLDSLPDDERALVDPASVIGLSFPRPAVETLVVDDIRDRVTPLLGTLIQRQLVRPAPGDAESEAYRFGHMLIRDAAYAGLLKRTRADLHERFVAWADEANRERGRAQEFEEILGYHLEQAHRYHAELGPLDAHGTELGIRASERLGSAGARAFARGDLPAAASLLGRAAATLPSDHPARPALLLRTGEARLELGEFGPAGEALDAARGAASSIGAQAEALAAELESLRLRWLIGAAGPDEDLVAQVEGLIGALERAGADEGIARAYRLLATLEFTAGRWGSAERAFEAIIEYARRSGNETMETRALVNLGVLAVYGPTPVEDGIARANAILPRVAGDRRAVAGTTRSLAHLRAMVGDIERAREEYAQARLALEDLGWNFDAALTSLDSGPSELIAGDPAVAEQELRRDYMALERMGDKNYISTTAAYLAEALVRQGRDGEAAAMAEFSASLAADDDVLTQVVWRAALARVRARTGDPDAGLDLAREAVRRARTSDDLNGLADALAALGETARLADRRDDAVAAFTEAGEHYARKGNVVSGGRVAARLGELTARRVAG